MAFIRYPVLIYCLLTTALTFVGCNDNKSDKPASLAAKATADSIVVTEPAWDSLTRPLQMPAYYASISSEKQIAQASLRIDVYKGGELIQGASSVIRHFAELHPIEMSNAIYFKTNENGRSGFIVTTFGKERDNPGMSSFRLSLPDMATTSRALYRPYVEINPNGTTPLFAIACNADYYSGTDPTITTDYLIRYFGAQKDAILLVVSLVALQEIREFKPAPEQLPPAPGYDHSDTTVLTQSK